MTDISDEAGIDAAIPAGLEVFVGRLRDAIGVKGNAVLGIRIVDDRAMAELNREWRGEDEPTDVLSFPAGGDGFPAPEEILGDIVVCWPVIEANALEMGHAPERELYWAVTHGLLHILGWDHENEESLRAMEGRTMELMAECDIEVASRG